MSVVQPGSSSVFVIVRLLLPCVSQTCYYFLLMFGLVFPVWRPYVCVDSRPHGHRRAIRNRYIGELEDIFASSREYLGDGGILAFTCELTAPQDCDEAKARHGKNGPGWR